MLERLAEYFTLRGAASELARLDERARVELADGVALARQQMAAAEALFAVGHTVEALRLGTEALRETERSAERYARILGLVPPQVAAADAGAEPGGEGAARAEAEAEGEARSEPSVEGDPKPKAKTEGEMQPDAKAAKSEPKGAVPAWRLLAAHAGVSENRIRASERVMAELEKRALPVLEKDVSPAHVDAFRELVRARADLEEGVVPATLTKESLAGTRVFRIVGTTLLGLLTIVGLYFLLRPIEGTFVRASATWADSPDFRTDFVNDEDEHTMWLTPEFEGWIEVRVVPPIPSVRTVRLVNAGTPAVPDRGTHEYQLEIYADGRLARTIDGSFGEEFGATATHEVNVRNVERIRFIARSGYRRGSGLAELSWE
jgi:hypothetical protein